MARYSEARILEIRDHLSELTRRGVSVAEYAEEIGVSPWTLYSWRSRFEPSRPRADLIEVDYAPAPSAIEIIAGALTVRVPPGCDPDELERVLQVVRSC